VLPKLVAVVGGKQADCIAVPASTVWEHWKDVAFTFTPPAGTQRVEVRWEVTPDAPASVEDLAVTFAFEAGAYARLAPPPHPFLYFRREDVPALLAKAQKEKLRKQVAAELKAQLEGKSLKEQQDALNEALDEAVHRTKEYKAWQAEWDKMASHWECHYFGSGRTYCLIGNGLAEAMREMVEKP